MADIPIHQILDFTEVDFINFVLGERVDIETGNFAPALDSLNTLLQREDMIRFQQRIRFTVNGYDEDPRELFEIPEVRDWLRKVHDLWPHWFYFCSLGRDSSLIWISLGLCEYVKVPGGAMTTAGLSEFVLVCFNSLNNIARWLGMPDSANEKVTDDVLETLHLAEDV